MVSGVRVWGLVGFGVVWSLWKSYRVLVPKCLTGTF